MAIVYYSIPDGTDEITWDQELYGQELPYSYILAMGYIAMEGPKPPPVPKQHGIWYSRSNGKWDWVREYPEYNYALSKNNKTGVMTVHDEFGDPYPWEPSDCGVASLSALASSLQSAKTYTDNAVAPLTTQVSTLISGLSTANSNIAAASLAASNAATAAAAATTASQSAIKKADVVNITIPAGQTSVVVPLTGYSKVLTVLPVETWVADQMYVPGVTGFNDTSVTIVGKRTKGTLLLSSGPMESTSGTFQVVVIGR